MPEDENSAAAVAQVNDPPVTTDGTEPSGTTDATDKKESPGTPDKALQKMQQEVGNLSRQYAALMEKKAGGELNEADRAKLEKSKQRLETIRTKAQDFGLTVDGGTELAEQVLDLTEKASKQDALEAENRDMKARLERLENDRNWSIAKAKYPTLDTDAIWDKANTDAEKILGRAVTPDAKHALASSLFEERCDAAKARKGEPDPKAPKPKNGSPAMDYKVGSGQRVAPVLSEEEEVLAEARSLVRET